MKAIKDPVKEKFAMNYLTYFTKDFEKHIELARKKIEPFSKKEISQWTYYFEVKGEEVNDFDCCDDEKCIKASKKDIRVQYGKGTHVKEVYYANDGDHERIEICTQCFKPLNEWLTWCESELDYLEQDPFTPQSLKDEGFLIHCILQSSPTHDYAISDYAKHQGGEALQRAFDSREMFFQRIGKLAEAVIKADFTLLNKI
jgi:hypothetical protein